MYQQQTKHVINYHGCNLKSLLYEVIIPLSDTDIASVHNQQRERGGESGERDKGGEVERERERSVVEVERGKDGVGRDNPLECLSPT